MKTKLNQEDLYNLQNLTFGQQLKLGKQLVITLMEDLLEDLDRGFRSQEEVGGQLAALMETAESLERQQLVATWEAKLAA